MLRFNANHKRITEHPWWIIFLALIPLGILGTHEAAVIDLASFGNLAVLRLIGMIAAGSLLFLAIYRWRSIRCEGKRLMQSSLFRAKELRTKQAKAKVEKQKNGKTWTVYIDDGKKRIFLGKFCNEDKAQARADKIRATLGCS